jgi:5-methyltetrahydropteroyltriglutamate--homocysteine methyltransferase
MKQSRDRILATHVGSLTRPDELIALYRDNAPDEQLLPALKSSVAEIVKRQRGLGIDIVNDGEFGKAMRAAVDYGAWWSYVYNRLEGFELRPALAAKGRAGWTFGSKERQQFAQFYREDGGMGTSGAPGSSSARMFGLACTAPVRYTGQKSVARDLANLKAALEGQGAEEAFVTAVSPATLQIIPNEHYASRDDYTMALADAIHEEWKAIVDAGFVLQIDDPALVDLWDWWFSLNDDKDGFRRWAAFQVEAVNHALAGIPEDRVRFHICWGSWHGPHSGDLPLAQIVDLLLKVKAQAYVVEAGNVRHEHEWKVWRDVAKLPPGKILIPGVVSHATNVLEHPELVADRLVRYAEVVGRENIIAGTDCGLGGRIHPQLAWAKLEALSEGAKLASQQLWR